MKKYLAAVLVLISTPAIACQVDEDWFKEKESEFIKMDKDGDKKLSYGEYKEELKNKGAPSYVVKEMWDGYFGKREEISLQEYQAFKKPKCAGVAEETEIEIIE